MFRAAFETGLDYTGFPRIRGDVPMLHMTQFHSQRFSPHTRGCSATLMEDTPKEMVFPAYAGMFLKGVRLRDKEPRFPRIRGDVPIHIIVPQHLKMFSPHTRGCSGGTAQPGVGFPVFPAYAGMFRVAISWSAFLPSFPRIRGDVPLSRTTLRRYHEFSPHTRGCSRPPHRPRR